MLGKYFYLDENKKFMCEVSMGVGAMLLDICMPINVNVYHRISKYVLISFGIEHNVYVASISRTGASLGLGLSF